MQTLFFKLPEDGTDFGPAFRTPLTDIAAGALHADYGRCVPFNAKYLNCMEAYGNIRGRKECVIYFQDLTECIHPRKQVKTCPYDDVSVVTKRRILYIR